MKKRLVLLAITLSFTSTVFAKNSSMAELDLKIHTVVTLKKTEKANIFEKLNEVSEMDIAVLANNETSHDIKKSANLDKLTYSINKNLIRIQDEKSDIDTEVPVNVQKSILGRIKSFEILGENLETIYFESLKRSGIISLRDMDLKYDQRKSLTIGAQSCRMDHTSDLLICEQDTELKVLQNKFVLIAAIFLLQFDI